MSSSVENRLKLVRNKSHVWGSVSKFVLGLGTEVQMRTNRQEFWTHVSLRLSELETQAFQASAVPAGPPQKGDARREGVGYAHISPIE